MIRPAVERRSACDETQLSAFVAGELSPALEGEVIQHLDTCAVCQHRLEQLAGDERWWRDSQVFLSPERDDPCEHPVTVSDEPGDDEETGTPPPISLDFLAPSDDPQSVGRLGTYEVRGVVGRGGTGIVLKAFDPSLNRFVAIKVLDPYLAGNAAARRRFAREGRAAAAITQEQIVPIHAVSEHQGLPFIVMQYISGQSLQQRIERDGPLDLADVLRIGMQTAQGLAAAHAQGLIHRDVKPANILLENGIERVLLTDFGLARTMDEASLTCSGVIAGTPQYMAPEQALGEPIDHRTDLFSLGSVLYAMCTGHSPFRAETTMGILHRICHATPRPIQATRPEIPRWMSAIIACLHAKQPSQRFHSAAEVAALLQQQLARLQSPSGALGLTWTEARLVTQDWISRHRKWLTSYAVIAAVIIIVVRVWIGVPKPVVQKVGWDEALRVPPTATPELVGLEDSSHPTKPVASMLDDEFASAAAWRNAIAELDGQLAGIDRDWFMSPASADAWPQLLEQTRHEWRQLGWPAYGQSQKSNDLDPAISHPEGESQE